MIYGMDDQKQKGHETDPRLMLLLMMMMKLWAKQDKRLSLWPGSTAAHISRIRTQPSSSGLRCCGLCATHSTCQRRSTKYTGNTHTRNASKTCLEDAEDAEGLAELGQRPRLGGTLLVEGIVVDVIRDDGPTLAVVGTLDTHAFDKE